MSRENRLPAVAPALPGALCSRSSRSQWRPAVVILHESCSGKARANLMGVLTVLLTRLAKC